MAIHSFTPFYSAKDKAKRFSKVSEAKSYADRELFTTPEAYEIEAVIS